jgi:hypothetical protein
MNIQEIYPAWKSFNFQNFKSDIEKIALGLKDMKAEFEQLENKLNDFDFNKEMVETLVSTDV